MRIRGVIVLNGLLAAVLPAPAARAAIPTPASKVFAGPEGLTVSVVPLPSPSGDHTPQALVSVSGSGTVFDGKAIPHKVDNVDSGKTNFETTYHGRSWNTIVLRDGSYSLYVPGRRDDLRIHFDEKRTAALKPDAILAAYQKQKSDGTLQGLAAFDRKAEVAQQEKGLQPTIDGFFKACGVRPPVKVDWGSMSDADVQEISIASYCGEPLEAMRRLCQESAEARTTIAAKVKGFTCVMGKSMQLDLSASTLKWTTSRSGTNMGDFARNYLEKAL